MIGVPRHHAIAMAKPPVKVAPRVGVVTYRGRQWYAQRGPRGLRLLQPVPQRRVRIPRTIGNTGSELAAGLRSPVGQAIESAIPGGSQAAAVVEMLAPLLDTSLKNYACVPGNPNYPACLTPGGGAAALTQSLGNEQGLSPAIAARIVQEAVQQGGLGGGGAQGLGKNRILREN